MKNWSLFIFFPSSKEMRSAQSCLVPLIDLYLLICRLITVADILSCYVQFFQTSLKTPEITSADWIAQKQPKQKGKLTGNQPANKGYHYMHDAQFVKDSNENATMTKIDVSGFCLRIKKQKNSTNVCELSLKIPWYDHMIILGLACYRCSYFVLKD